MDDFNDIIDEIVVILGGVSGIAEAHAYDKAEFGSYPAAIVVPSENKSEYATTTQNLREYVFTVRLHYPMEKTGDANHLKADQSLRNLVIKVLDAFDANYTLNSTVNFSRAAPSAWGYQTRGAGTLRVTEVTLTGVKLKTVI